MNLLMGKLDANFERVVCVYNVNICLDILDLHCDIIVLL